MTEPYFNFTFDNTYTISNVTFIFTTPMWSNKLPISSTLVKRLNGTSYDPTSKIWKDYGFWQKNTSASDTVGNPTVSIYNANTSNVNGAMNLVNAVNIASTSGFNNLNDREDVNYTLFNIARYIGTNKQRILQSYNEDSLYGFHGGKNGVAYYNKWMTSQTNKFMPITTWVISSTTPTSYRGNGTDYTTDSQLVLNYLPQLSINNKESSDCEVAEIIIYSSILTVTQIQQTELYLSGLYGIYGTNLVATMSGGANLSSAKNVFGNSSLSLISNSNSYLNVPQFNISTGTGISFSLWFNQPNLNSDNVSIFDFGEVTTNNISMYFKSNNLGISVYNGPSSFCQLENVLSNFVINTWNHVVWTISVDGTTWMIYLNGNLIQTITSSNYNNYSPSNNSGSPIYPKTTSLINSNFIGKSNTFPSKYYDGYIDEFKMFMTTITSDDVKYLFTNNTTYVVPPVSNSNKGCFFKKGIPIEPISGCISMYAGSTGTFTVGNNDLNYNIYTAYHNDNPEFVATVTKSGSVKSISDINVGTNKNILTTTQTAYTVIWTGYFLPDYTGTWTFNLSSDDGSYLWLGPTALANYMKSNSLINNGGSHGIQLVSSNIDLIAGTYYPIRIMTGNSGGPGDCIFSWERNSSSTLTDGTNYFWQGTTKINNINGWLYCDGSAYSRSTYVDLFNIIGTTHGEGDGVTTFNVPNLKSKYVRGINRNSNVPIQVGGKSTVRLTTDNLPPHSHDGPTDNSDWIHSHSVDIQGGGVRITNESTRTDTNNDFGDWNSSTQHEPYSMGSNGQHQHTFNTNPVGSSEPLSIIPPSLFINFIIKT